MASISDVTPAQLGLRAYDISLGFRNLDERKGALPEFTRTQIVGMASSLANAIKGRDVIRDARILKRIAAEVLKINPYAFEGVVSELAELEVVKNVRRQGGEIVSFTEHVPLIHNDLHEQLGIRWIDEQPTEIESKLLLGIHLLAQSPLPATVLRKEIDADSRTDQLLRAVGEGAELIRGFHLRDGTEIATSPLFAFEQPASLIPLFENHTSDGVRSAFCRVRGQAGLPIVMDGSEPIIEDMIRMGLAPAPTVVGADSIQRAFVVIPYGLDPSYLTVKKQVLERTLALIACVRCGEISGGMTPIRFPDSLLAALMDPYRDYRLKPHSSTERQYAPLISRGVIQTVQVGGMLAARLVPTLDNIEAVQLARTLLQRQGDGLPERGNEHEAAQLLFTGGDYLVPIETIALARRSGPSLTGGEVEGLWGQAIGWSY